MKIHVLNIEGRKEGEIETPIFSGGIREDIIQKVVECEKRKQPYAPFYLAGKQSSASGKIRHGRRKWKTAYGKGISRVPRKIFWRRGTQFYWQGATIASARGGRRAHPPRVLSMINEKKINKKEYQKAFFSALALTASKEKIKEKYQTLNNEEIKISFPIIIEDKIIDLNTKEFFNALQKILDNLTEIALQKRSIRAGKGKSRGRRYRKSAGLLFVVGNKNEKKIKNVDICRVDELKVSDLASNGARLTIYTKQAVKDIEDKLSGDGKKEKKETEKEKKIDKRKIRREKRKKNNKKLNKKESKGTEND